MYAELQKLLQFNFIRSKKKNKQKLYFVNKKFIIYSELRNIISKCKVTGESKVIKDIKAPLGAPLTFKEMLPWILGGIVVALIIYFIFYYLRRRKQAKPLFQIKSKPKIPPHRKALEAFDKLKNEKLWQNGKVKTYHTELTDIIRVYLEERYNIMAVEMTTDEILEALKKHTIDKKSMEKLDQTLVLADFVKFAKLQPLPLEHDMSLNNSVEFVKDTMHRAMENPNIEQNQDTDGDSENTSADNDNLLKE